MKSPGAVLAVALGPKGKDGASKEAPSEPEVSEASPKDEYKSILADAAKAGDWEAFAEAVEGIARSCAMKGAE